MKYRTPASDRLATGWLPTNAAAAKLGITKEQLEQRHRRGEIKREAIVPGVYIYEVNARGNA